VDVLLLLGGFDLDPLLDHSWDDFEMLGDSLAGSTGGEAELSQAELDQIVRNLDEYADRNSG
jgi:hypothetical protein